MHNEDNFKVAIIGDANVGKTSIVNRYTKESFTETAIATVGVSNSQVKIQVGQRSITLNIWDTAGQERFRSLIPLYTRGAYLILLVFSIVDRASFDNLDEWMSKIHDELQLTCPIILIGNKHDMPSSFDLNLARQWAENNGQQIFLTSAATGENIRELFQAAATAVINSLSSCENSSGKNPKSKTEGNSGCCH